MELVLWSILNRAEVLSEEFAGDGTKNPSKTTRAVLEVVEKFANFELKLLSAILHLQKCSNPPAREITGAEYPK